jgi:hypothetical protein
MVIYCLSSICILPRGEDEFRHCPDWYARMIIKNGNLGQDGSFNMRRWMKKPPIFPSKGRVELVSYKSVDLLLRDQSVSSRTTQVIFEKWYEDGMPLTYATESREMLVPHNIMRFPKVA